MKNKYATVLDDIAPSGIRRFFDLVQSQKDVISLGVGEPDFVTPWNIREEAIYSLEKGYTSYTSNKGLVELRKYIAHYLDKKFQAKFHYDKEILVTVGVSQGIDITLRSILNLGDEVIVAEPSYVCYQPLIKLAGGKSVPIDTSNNNFVLNAKSIEKKINKKTKAIFVCSPNNPTGAVIPWSEMLNIAKLAKKYDLWILSDEIYAELSYEKKYFSFGSITSISDRTIILSGFSKAFAMTGWRIGYIAGPEEVINRALKIHQYSMLCAPILSQYGAIDALKNSASDVEDMVKSYKLRRNLMVKSFNEMGLDTVMPEGAFYCFPSIKKTGLTSEEFALQLLKSENVAVVPGVAFGKAGEGFIRCCYATNIDNIKEALVRIKRFVQRF